jgi:hypothetical protein
MTSRSPAAVPRGRRRAPRLSDLLQARALDARALPPNARLAGATPLWDWIGESATVFSY